MEDLVVKLCNYDKYLSFNQMIFILLLSMFIHIQSKFITYTLYQTDDICQFNWKDSICLPIFSLNQTDRPLLIKLNLNKENQCSSQVLVYIRTQQCIYCSKNLEDIHCHHRRLRRMIPVKKEQVYRNSIAIIGISLIGILIIGSLFTLLFIKRSQAHTNLLELLQPNSNIQSIRVPRNIKSIQINPIHLTVPQTIKPTK
jgi:hypothetical protein